MNKLTKVMESFLGRKKSSADQAKERLKALQEAEKAKPELKKAA
ncbi:MAG: hypothetical protein NTX57_11830 [Armatimonadetes bacterium]|jgi:septum formation topological specificity factor MinE|nr:hypothetical protein [Armatimonadota bacterium]